VWDRWRVGQQLPPPDGASDRGQPAAAMRPPAALSQNGGVPRRQAWNWRIFLGGVATYRTTIPAAKSAQGQSRGGRVSRAAKVTHGTKFLQEMPKIGAPGAQRMSG
jgi:hypothetical protein